WCPGQRVGMQASLAIRQCHLMVAHTLIVPPPEYLIVSLERSNTVKSGGGSSYFPSLRHN
ncbi:hypothetical protein, partial [Brucella anthropi]|uniref:hypothetical protein n=1 Tax=Brucella anthropi TaxID=529 RepID=UPI001AED9227